MKKTNFVLKKLVARGSLPLERRMQETSFLEMAQLSDNVSGLMTILIDDL